MTPETTAEVLAQAATFLTTLAATFVGAWLAFRLEKRHADKRDRDRDLAAGKETRFALAAQYTLIRNLKDQHFDAHLADPLRFLKARPVPVFGPHPKIETAKLLFLLESSDPDLLNHIYLAERRFRSVMGILRQRNRFHLQFQKALAATSPKDEVMAVEEMERRVGPPLFAHLVHSTDGLYKAFEDALAQNQATTARLQATLNRLFPGHREMKIVPLQPGEDKG